MLLQQYDDDLKNGSLNYWLSTKGRVPNACVGRFVNQAMSLKVGMES